MEKQRWASALLLRDTMAHVNIWIHAVWGTKNHERILLKEIRQKLFQHIRENAKEKKMYIDFINGDMDHVHCLLALNADMSIAKAIQLIKGEAAHWANTIALMKHKLDWADEYYAASVSESMIDAVRNYIKNQEEHHKVATFKSEYEELMEKYRSEYQG